MRLPERLENALSRIREKLGDRDILEFSLRQQTSWLKKGIVAKRPRELLDQELDALDSFAPLSKLLVNTIYGNPDLLMRFFNTSEPENRIKELCARCMVEIERSEELDEKKVQAIAEKVISQEEPPPEVKELMEKLEKSPYVPGERNSFFPWEI